MEDSRSKSWINFPISINNKFIFQGKRTSTLSQISLWMSYSNNTSVVQDPLSNHLVCHWYRALTHVLDFFCCCRVPVSLEKNKATTILFFNIKMKQFPFTGSYHLRTKTEKNIFETTVVIIHRLVTLQQPNFPVRFVHFLPVHKYLLFLTSIKEQYTHSHIAIKYETLKNGKSSLLFVSIVRFHGNKISSNWRERFSDYLWTSHQTQMQIIYVYISCFTVF